MQSFKTFAVAAIITVAASGGGSSAQAPAAKAPAGTQAKHTMVSPAELKWGPAPPSLPTGAQVAVLDGDPAKAGLFTLRVKMPDGYAVPPHRHPAAEHVTVISGSLMVGMGAKIDEATMQAMNAGGYTKMPARMNHYVRAKGETILQITAMGPFEVTYVNPNDDPRKKTTTSKK
ncbi:MAG TPA: cupin domain-containing protein [Vicinamibacterales bacterium]|nr:cupin domain-containing protein [Vicinamibacterales bacterium]